MRLFDSGQVNRLPIQVGIVVPSTRDEDVKISDSAFRKRVETTRKFLDKRFGGDTTIDGSGGYVGGGSLITEETALVVSSTTESEFERNRDSLRRFIREKRRNWGQDTLAYMVEGDLYIYPERDYISDQPLREPRLPSIGNSSGFGFF